MELIGFSLAFVIGMVMGLIGAGGSILTSGLMIYVFGLNPVISASYTLLNVGAISLIGAVQYYRKNLVDISTGLIFSFPAIMIVFCMRAYVMPSIPPIIFQYHKLTLSKELLIMLVFAILMILIAWNMIKSTRVLSAPKLTVVNKPVIFATGSIVGILTGFVGVGGGFIIVPALFFFTALDMKKAVGTSLFIITLTTSIGFFSDFSTGVVYNWMFLSKFILFTVAGMLICEPLVNKIKTNWLKKSFAIVMLLIGCWIIVKELFMKNI